jgi:Mg-chelatase subunit ChlD
MTLRNRFRTHVLPIHSLWSALLLAGLVACGAASSDFGDGDGGDGAPPDGSDPNGAGVEPGQLTAAEWDDNDYFPFYLQSLTDLFGDFVDRASLPATDRVVVTVRDADERPIAGARVEVLDSDRVFLDAITGTDGRLLVFPGHDGATDGALSVRITAPGAQPIAMPAPDGDAWSLLVPDVRAPAVSGLDLAFVVDATGSMSDELAYLQAEIQAIAEDVGVRHPDTAIRYALIVYRDEGDDYVTRTFDFTDDLAAFVATLADQSADGGGDYPEAMDQAMSAAMELSWRQGEIARLAFLIADAPPHSDRGQALLDQADVARRVGVRIYPIAASGVADEAEYLMRAAAQATGGRYVFLTDDSGIGNTHAEPHVPCYRVEHLDALLVRTLDGELQGRPIEPEGDAIVRVVGEYDESGRCIVADAAGQ